MWGAAPRPANPFFKKGWIPKTFNKGKGITIKRKVYEKMKRISSNKIIVVSVSLLLLVTMLLSACGKKEVLPEIWENATYTEDTTLGEGTKVVDVYVTAGEKSVKLTIKTDEKTLGDALKALNIIEGDDSEFGIYIKKTNGIVADYDIDASWWGFNKVLEDGTREIMLSGVDGVDIVGGEVFELIYSK